MFFRAPKFAFLKLDSSDVCICYCSKLVCVVTHRVELGGRSWLMKNKGN